MSIGDWDALAPLGAGMALVALVAMPLGSSDKGEAAPWRDMALEQAAPGQAVAWSDERRNVGGLMVADDLVRGSDGTLCRSYSLSVRTGERERVTRHTACRVTAGLWRERGMPEALPPASPLLAASPD